VFFDPFCGADEGVFFGVPGSEYTVITSASRPVLREWDLHIATWFPACFHKLSKCLGHFDENRTAGIRIRCSTYDPCIAMVADDDCLVCVRAIDDTDDVPDRCRLLFHEIRELEGDARRGPSTIRRIESANPITPSIDFLCRYTVSIQCFEQRQRIAIRYRYRRNPRKIRRLTDPINTCFRSIARRRRVARVLIDIRHRSALYRRRMPSWTIRIRFLPFCYLRSVVAWVGVHDYTEHAVRFCVLDFDASIWAAVFRECDFTFESSVRGGEGCEVVFVGSTTS